MSEYWRNHFRKVRGTGLYIYDIKIGKLVFISDSIQYAIDNLGIHRVTLLRYSSDLELYLVRFQFIQDYHSLLDNSNPIDLKEFLLLLDKALPSGKNMIILKYSLKEKRF